MAGAREMGRNGEDPAGELELAGAGIDWAEQQTGDSQARLQARGCSYCTCHSDGLVRHRPRLMLAVILFIVPCPFVVWCHVQLHRRARPGCFGGGGSRVLVGCGCLHYLGEPKDISWMVGGCESNRGVPGSHGPAAPLLGIFPRHLVALSPVLLLPVVSHFLSCGPFLDLYIYYYTILHRCEVASISPT